MLKAFYEQLRLMASSTDDKFHDHVRNRIGKAANPALQAELKDAILCVPEVISVISTLWSQLKTKSRVKELSSYFITYMYSPQDFIPENEANGLFGYMDDAYLTFTVYQVLADELQNTGILLSVEHQKLREQVVGYKSKIQSVIADEASKIQQMVGEILSGEDFVFSEHFIDPQDK